MFACIRLLASGCTSNDHLHHQHHSYLHDTVWFKGISIDQILYILLKPVCRAARCFSALCSYSRAMLQLLFRRPRSSRQPLMQNRVDGDVELGDNNSTRLEIAAPLLQASTASDGRGIQAVLVQARQNYLSSFYLMFTKI